MLDVQDSQKTDSPQEAGKALVSAQPTYQEALRLHRAGKTAQAKAAYDRVVAREPENGDAWFGVATLFAQQGAPHDAIICFEKAMAVLGPRPEIHHNMAAAKSALGRLLEAEVHYREAIRLKPDYYEAYFNFSNVRRFNHAGPIIATVEEFLRNGDLEDQDRCFLHFAAGKLYDDMGVPARAFPHFKKANATRPARFDAMEVYRKVAAIAQGFPAGRIEAFAGHGAKRPRVIMVVGMPRSGTSMVEQLLAAHGDVAATGEGPALNQTTTALGATIEREARAGGASDPSAPLSLAYPDYVPSLTPALLTAGGEDYAVRLARKVARRGEDPRDLVRRKVLVDKTPLNFRHLGLASAILPDVKIVHCRRDPLDTCLSCYFQNFRTGHDYSFDLEHLGFFYGQYHWLMSHWVRAGVRMHELVYEDFVRNPEQGARDLLAFCGLSWDEAVLDFHQIDRAVHTASRAQVRRPVYTASVGRARAYGAFLDPLKAALSRARVPFRAG